MLTKTEMQQHDSQISKKKLGVEINLKLDLKAVAALVLNAL